MKRASTLLSSLLTFAIWAILVSSTLPATAQTYSLTATPDSVTPGGTITVEWSAPSGRPSWDWIGLYKVGESNYAYRWWTYTYGATSGSRNVTAPADPGTYEFRYLQNNGYTDVARSNTIAVGPVYTVTASPSTATLGQSLTVSWTAPAGRPYTDWIGLFKAGSSNYSYIWWRYTQGATSGSFSVPGPVDPGDYEFRYLVNNAYTSVAASNRVKVEPTGGGTYTLEATPTTVTSGEAITVSWTAPSGRPWSDWIGLYRVGASNYSYGWWNYTNGTTSGSFNVLAPAEPGQYEFRYLLNNGYTDTARSGTITVNQDSTTYSLTPSATSVKVGSSMSVSWTAPAGRPYWDWIGIFKVGASNYEYGWYVYTSGATSGTANLTAPSLPGSYEFRYLQNNGYTDVARSVTVTVTQ